MGRRLAVLGALLAGGGCSFIDSFDYEFVDGAVSSMDAGPGSDAGPRPDVPAIDGGTDPDAGGPRSCAPPCLTDAILDFDPDTQGSGEYEWRYLKDTRGAVGLAYVELVPGEHAGLPAWTDSTPPPAIVACALHDGAGACAGAADHLLVVPDQPGVSSGGDPVIAFTAPTSGTFVVTARLRARASDIQLLLSRNSRWDLVAVADIEGSTSDAVSVLVELLAGDRLLVGARPAPGATSAEPGELEVRVSRYLDGEPLDACMFAARFATGDPLVDECGGHTLVNEGNPTPTSETPGPGAGYGAAREFPEGAVMKATGARFDYSGDFTVQLWAKVTTNFDYETAIYADWSAANPSTAGGVALFIDPDDGVGEEDIVTAGYLFPDPGGLSDPDIECSDGSCSGSIVSVRPPNGEWHLYRIVRDTAAEVVRFCIDGQEVGNAPLPGAIDVSNPHAPWLGSFNVLRDPSFVGAVDDVRIVRRALPCL